MKLNSTVERYCLHGSTKVNEAVDSKMAANELVREGVVVICDYIINECQHIIENRNKRKRRRWWVKPLVFFHYWLGQSTTSTFPGVTDGMLDVEAWEEGRIIPGCWRQVKAEGMKNATVLHCNNYTRNASDVRDKYAEMFCSSEVVPWQWMMI
jgi:hypothetical protein